MEEIRLNDLKKVDLKGKVIVFPTDTVYGVGCMVDDIEAIHKIYDLKNRDYSKPLAILTPDNKIDKYVKQVSKKALELMNEYWPGALTIIYEKSDLINNTVTSNLNTVGFRMPNSKVALEVLNTFGVMATTSINISGSAPLNDKYEIIKEFKDKIDYIVMDDEISSLVSSTVVSAIGDEIKVLRQGKIIIK